MSIALLQDVLQELGVETEGITADTRLRADLALDSIETAELELALGRRFGVRVDLWDATDYSLVGLAELIDRTRAAVPEADPVADRRRPGIEIPRVPADRAQEYRDVGWWRPVPLGTTIYQQDPGRCALVAGDRRVTYGELAATVDRVARRLVALGIEAGDPVVVQLPNTVEYVALVLALLRIGAPPVLTPPNLGAYELERILDRAEPTAIAVPGRTRHSDQLGAVRRLRPKHPSLAHVLVAGVAGGDPAETIDLIGLCDPARPGDTDGAPAAVTPPEPGDAALFLLSSGTTGPPKLMGRTHEDYGYVVASTAAVAGVSADTVYLAVMPATHTFVLAYPGIIGTLSAGGTVVLGGAENPQGTLALIERERVTHTAAVPALVTQWVNCLPTAGYDVSSLAVLQVGGARLDAALAARAKDAFGCVIQQVYGMSEGLANFTRLHDPDETTFTSQGRPACPGDEILIVDEDGRPVPDGQVGQLLTRGPSTVAGYFRDEPATGRAFTADGFYRTGDLVRLRRDGNLEVTGRIKNLINRGGEKISAEELEQLSLELPTVTAAAAVAMPHPVYGEIACLFVVADGTPPDLGQVRRLLLDRGLARHKLPERLEHLPAMPLIGVGKPDRTALRERAARLAAASVPAS
ncbi:AMP-binding protein [Actinoplanes sp. NPDC049118]|uniref:AMP-binding protein n=1 Tax=Actinoplanes sp. NPDC049118 TaxID=3155769 RepID=UPI0033E233CE